MIMADEKSMRDQRLADALRANLRRRKSQSRARDREDDPAGAARGHTEPSEAGSIHSDQPAPDAAEQNEAGQDS